MFENPRRGRQARNFTTNAPKILDLKSSSEQLFSRKLPLGAPVTPICWLRAATIEDVKMIHLIHCHALMTLTAIGKFQLSQLVVLTLRLLLLTPLWVGCHTLWSYMITNYFWGFNNLRETRIQNLLGIWGWLYYTGGNKQFKFAGLKIKLTK